jgi:uncharacterized protein involved in outer membrane biogenesis
MKKKILIGAVIGVMVLLVLVVVVVGFFLGNVVKAGMNTIGPKVTQTTFNVEAVHISALTGSVGLDNFVIGNPDGYKSPSSISMSKTSVSVVPFSVLSDKIVVKNIEVHEPDITFEGNPFGANNLKKLMDNVNAFTGSSGAKPAGTNAPASAANAPAKKLEVDNFLISGAKVHFNGATLPLPDIHLTDLGKGSDGITPTELFKDVLDEVTTATLKAIASSAGDAGKAVGNEATKLGKSVTDLFKK